MGVLRTSLSIWFVAQHPEKQKVRPRRLPAMPQGYDLTLIVHPSPRDLERAKIWKAFTPQIFKKDLLNKSFLNIKKNTKYTDEASVVEANDGVLRMVQGSNDNIKLTFSEDIPLIRSILSSQGRGEDSS